MLKRYTPLKRTPVKKKRSKPRPGRLAGEDIKELRLECWMRDKGICQDCGQPTLYGAQHVRNDSYHMAHIKVKRMGGDNIGNVKTSCGRCHRKHHTGGKVVPPKVRD